MDTFNHKIGFRTSARPKKGTDQTARYPVDQPKQSPRCHLGCYRHEEIAQEPREKGEIPQILMGASSSSRLGCERKISLAAAQSCLISDSDSCAFFPGLRFFTSRSRRMTSSSKAGSILSSSTLTPLFSKLLNNPRLVTVKGKTKSLQEKNASTDRRNLGGSTLGMDQRRGDLVCDRRCLGDTKMLPFCLVSWSLWASFFSYFFPLLGCSPAALVLADGGGSLVGFWRGFGLDSPLSSLVSCSWHW